MAGKKESDMTPRMETELPTPWKTEDELARKDIANEEDFGKMLFMLFYAAREAQKPWVAKWRRLDRMYRGDQWDKVLEPWRAQLVVNVCFSTVETQLPIIADVDPRMTIMNVEGGDKATAEMLDFVFTYNMRKYDWDEKIETGQRTTLKLGDCVWKVGWDPDIGFHGDVTLSKVKPINFIPDPMALTLDDCKYVFETKIVTIAELKRLYPDKVELIDEKITANAGLVSSTDDVDRVKDEMEVQETRAYNRGLLPSDKELERYSPGGIRDQLLKCLLVMGWIKDYSLVDEEYEEEDEDGNKVKARRKVRKYPGGRMVDFVGDVILKDEPNPFWHRRLPYVIVPDYPDDENFWDMGEIEQIEKLQQEINKRASQVSDNATALGNPIWIIDDTSMVKASQLKNKPGSVVKKRHGTEVRRDNPPELPQYILEAQDRALRNVEDLTGVHEIMRGRNPTGITAYSAIRALQDAAETRVRQKIRRQLAALRRIARLICACYMQFYDEDRFRRICGDEMVDRVIASRKANENIAQEGDELKFELEEVYEQYDIYSETEALTRVTRDFRREQMKELFEYRVIDNEALLDAYDIPDKDKILERMGLKKKKEEEAPAPESMPPLPEAPGAGVPPELLSALGQGGPPAGAPPAMPPAIVPPGPPGGAMPMEPGPGAGGLNLPEGIPPELLLQLLGQGGVGGM